MLYASTRGLDKNISFEQVLFSAYASDGGLYVPQSIPVISYQDLFQWKDFTFSQICAQILSLYCEISLEQLNQMTAEAYQTFQSKENIPLPMTQVGDVIVLDASLGPTMSFKDVGQQMVARLLNYYLQNSNKKAKIAVDTSGNIQCLQCEYNDL